MYFECGKKEYLTQDCLNRKNDSKSAKPTNQNQKRNVRVFASTELDTSASDQVVTNIILINP